MPSENLEEQSSAFSWMVRAIPRTIPHADFVRNLGQEIGQAARQRMRRAPEMPFEATVVELRKLIRLLCETLVPIQPRLAFVQELGGELVRTGLRPGAAQVRPGDQERWRWLMIGSAVGSLLSLLGVLTALLLRRRHTARLRSDFGSRANKFA